MKSNIVVLFLIIASLSLLVAGCGNQTPTANVAKNTQSNMERETIKIGYIGPLTGDVASIGIAGKNGMILAVEEINKKGGINGKLIEAIYENSKCNGKDASSAAQKLVNMDDVDYIVGGYCSSETIGAYPITEENKRILFSPCSSNPDITTAGDYVFRDYPSDTFQGAYAAEFAYSGGVRKVAILSCLSDWCVGLKDVFSARFEELGGEVLSIQEFTQGSPDLRSQLTKIKRENPDLIYMPAYTDSTVNGLKQANELGLDMSKFLGADAWIDENIWNQLGKSADGVRFLTKKNVVPEDFQDRYRQRFNGKEISICTAETYDIVKILAEKISEYGDNVDKVKDSLYSVKKYKGMSGEITLDNNGDLVKAEYDTMKIEGGTPVEI